MAWSSSAGAQWGITEDEVMSLRHYLLFRGLNSTAKAFENELKQDKEKSFRVDKIMEQILHFTHTCDIMGLKDYWSFLQQTIFASLDDVQMTYVAAVYDRLLRYYLIHACQQGKNDKVDEFFDKMAPQLASGSEWKEWFVMPFLKNPEESAIFTKYFNKQWQDTFLLTLHNFLCIAMASLRRPSILNFEDDGRRIDALELENATLKQRIDDLNLKDRDNTTSVGVGYTIDREMGGNWNVGPPSDLFSATNIEALDDFYHLNNQKPKVINGTPTKVLTTGSLQTSHSTAQMASCSPAGSMPTPSSRSSLTSFFRNITGNSNVTRKPHQQNSRISDLQYHDAINPENTTDVSDGHSSSLNSLSYNSTLSTTPTFNSTSDSANYIFEGCAISGNPAVKSITSDQHHEEHIPKTSKTSIYAILSQEIYTDHSASVVNCKFSSSGKSVASLDSDGVLKTWSCLPSPKTTASTMSKSVLTTLEWFSTSDKFLLLGSKIGCIRIFDVKDTKVIKEINSDNNFPRLTCIASHPNGTSFVTSSLGRFVSSAVIDRTNQLRVGRLAVWDLDSDVKLKRYLPISPGPMAINCLAYNKQGNLLLAGGADGQIRLYDMRSHDAVADWPGHKSDITTISFASNGTSCYSLATDSKLIQWSFDKITSKMAEYSLTEGGKCSAVIGGGRSFVLSDTCSHVLIGWGNKATIYKFGSDSQLQESLSLGEYTSPVTCVDWSETRPGGVCLTATQEGAVRVTSLEMKPT